MLINHWMVWWYLICMCSTSFGEPVPAKSDRISRSHLPRLVQNLTCRLLFQKKPILIFLCLLGKHAEQQQVVLSLLNGPPLQSFSKHWNLATPQWPHSKHNKFTTTLNCAVTSRDMNILDSEVERKMLTSEIKVSFICYTQIYFPTDNENLLSFMAPVEGRGFRYQRYTVRRCSTPRHSTAVGSSWFSHVCYFGSIRILDYNSMHCGIIMDLTFRIPKISNAGLCVWAVSMK